MGKGIVEEKKKKKKGRPSLLDLQKRNLREQQQQQHQKFLNQNPNPNPNFSNSNSSNNNRSTRRNPINDAAAAAATVPESNLYEEEEEEEEEEEDEKLKFLLRLPPNQQRSSSSLNSAAAPPAAAAFLNSGGDYVFDEDGSNGGGGEMQLLKRRKINAGVGGDGSGLLLYNADHHDEKGQNSNSKAIDDSLQDKPLEFGPTTPLPDKQLLVFILDRLQKKDIYSVFSEPVDPEELPDYHDIIEHPMDFGTVRKKLDAGAYTNLEQFEEDVFLICSNAMQYNAADTIYYRQARSIQELAKKNFENLRQESDDNEPEPEPKIVRRGRPPKHLKKPLGRPPLDRAGSDFSSDAALTSGGDKPGYNLRKGHVSDKSSAADASGRTRCSESSWSAEHKSERNDDFSGFMFKGMSQKFLKKLSDVDDTRRNTYLQSHSSGGVCEASVLTTFDGEKKQLMPVGLHTEYGYARSLARFAANLGPVAWKIASKKIEKALPAGMNFGPGWVVENEVQPLQAPLLVTSPPRPGPPQQPLSTPKISQSSSVTPQILESNGIKVLERQEPSDSLASAGLLNRSLRPSSAASTSAAVNRAPEPTFEHQESARGLIIESGFGLVNNNSSGIRPPFQIHQSSMHNPSLNGFTGAFATQMTKLVRPGWQHGSFSSDSSVHSRQLEAVSGSNNLAPPPPPNNFIQPENQAIFGAAGFHHPQQIWRPPSLQQKPNLVPPDLNVRFQLPGSPSSGVRVDSSQPDLALQL